LSYGFTFLHLKFHDLLVISLLFYDLGFVGLWVGFRVLYEFGGGGLGFGDVIEYGLISCSNILLRNS